MECTQSESPLRADQEFNLGTLQELVEKIKDDQTFGKREALLLLLDELIKEQKFILSN